MKKQADKLSQENRELKEKVGVPISYNLLSIDKCDERPAALQERGKRQPQQEIQRSPVPTNINHCFLP